MSSKTKQSLITGAAILGMAALLSKLLGAVYRIPYQNITGDVGLAIYNRVYPLYSMLLILATAGFPIAISKIVSERLAVGDTKGARKAFKISVYVLSLTGFFFFLLLFFGSDYIANLMGNLELSLAIKSVSFALLIVPVMAAIRGYYQGHQYMTPTGMSQIIEQIIRVITILILSYWFMENGYGVYYAGAGAVFGAATGAVFALIVLLLYWKKIGHAQKEIQLEHPNVVIEEENVRTIIKRVLYYSIPIAAGSLALPILGVVDSFSVSNILALSTTNNSELLGVYIKGQQLVEYTEYWFGIYTRGQPLVQFAAFFATALFLALVPSISEAYTKKNTELIAKRSELALRLTLLIGLPASIGLAVLAEPINIMLYRDNTGSMTMSFLSYTTIFSTLFVTSSGILQGIGKVLIPARNLFFGIIVKVILNVLLVYYFHVSGAAIATVLTYATVTVLNIMGINKYVGLKIGFNNFFVKPIIASAMMGILVYGSRVVLLSGLESIIQSERLLMTAVALISVGIGIIGFGLSLFISKAMVRKDLEQIPKYGVKLIRVAEKLKILKD